jgi:hypothetical protein
VSKAWLSQARGMALRSGAQLDNPDYAQEVEQTIETLTFVDRDFEPVRFRAIALGLKDPGPSHEDSTD